MTNFSQEIVNFTNYGTYNYIFDDVGNQILNPSSSVFQQVYFVLPTVNYSYNNSKILSFYDPTFTEFTPNIPTTTLISTFSQEATDQINSITLQNTQLQSQLISLIANSEQNTGSANQQSIKNTIINLRIQLGQGSSTNDFQSIYPYFPNSIEMSNPPLS